MRKRNKIWSQNFKNFVKYNECLYIFENATLKKKFIRKNYNDSLINYFKIDKIIKLIQKKYY